MNNINENDVLSGRGGTINCHPGNVRFRNLVVQYKDAYKKANTRFEKMTISDKIVNTIRTMNPPGRFLAQIQGSWVEIGNEKARAKVSQALREKKVYKQAEPVVCFVNNKNDDATSPSASRTDSPLADESPIYVPSSHCYQTPQRRNTTTKRRGICPPLAPVSFDSTGDDFGHTSSIDSWDQGIVLGEGLQVDSGIQVQRILNDPKRNLFRGLKEEPTCLPSAWRKTSNLPDANALMMESFKSVESADMTSLVEMSSSDMVKQVEKPHADHYTVDANFVNTFDNSLRFLIDNHMDSTDKLIHDTFMTSVSSFDVAHDYKKYQNP